MEEREAVRKEYLKGTGMCGVKLMCYIPRADLFHCLGGTDEWCVELLINM